MKRRDFLHKSAMVGAASTFSLFTEGISFGSDDAKSSKAATNQSATNEGSIPVAFVISKGAVVIDFCGPWEVFQDAWVAGRNESPFKLYTVAESLEPVQGSGGLKIMPDYTFENAPAPKVIVIPAQRGQTDAMLNWIRKASSKADLTMSVCIGANVLAATGLLKGRSATTHHNSYNLFAAKNPDINVKRGVRFVDDGNVASAGGLSSGIDLALHVVERYFGKDAVKKTVYYMEYLGEGWQNPDANSMYKQPPVSNLQKPHCIVCPMTVDPDKALKVVLKGKEYYFCSEEHKELFEKNPKIFIGDGA